MTAYPTWRGWEIYADARDYLDAPPLDEQTTATLTELAAGDVRPIGTGWAVDTYEVGDGWIVQFPRDDRAAERMRAQIETLPELAAELPALVPEPIHMAVVELALMVIAVPVAECSQKLLVPVRSTEPPVMTS